MVRLRRYTLKNRKSTRTVLSRDAVAKTVPSGAHAQSQIIRVCDLSIAIGAYPRNISQGASCGIRATKTVPTGLFLLEQVP